MPMPLRVPTVLAVAVLGLAGGCGLPSYEFVDADGGAGASGASGDAGSAGTGADAGNAGAGGTGGCGPTENCYDGRDDDCDGQTDCADADCGPTSECVARPRGFDSGVLVGAAEACPAGYDAEERPLYRGPSVGTGCTGCGCTPKPIECRARIWAYGSAAECAGDTANVGGTYAYEVGADCDANKTLAQYGVHGVRVSPVIVKQSCDVSGTANPAPVSWGEEKKLCLPILTGRGCASEQVCAPRLTTASRCAIASGTSGVCGALQSRQTDWYTGFSDTRSCGACTCTGEGGSCELVSAQIFNDYSCGGAAEYAATGQRTCFANSRYAPPASMTPPAGNQPRCTTSASFDGEFRPTGQSTLCCAAP